ncbi:MAG: ABC-ATPase domain-containing protein [Desulfobacter sp.]|nr:MAG: ABC-ATPase domain-containing protein [Desulfobacter sp.]
MERLRKKIISIDGKGYKAYKGLQGDYRFPDYRLFIDHVQGDPYAAPSKLRVRIDRKTAGFPADTTSSRSRTIALCDHLTRQFCRQCLKTTKGSRGIGKSGRIIMDKPVQEVLNRTSMIINDRFVEARFFMGLPARGRKISGKDAMDMIFGELPGIIPSAMFMDNLDHHALYLAIKTAEDSDFLRSRLKTHRLTCFVANGSHLPRLSGIDSSPMDPDKAIPFKSPPNLEVQFHLPNSGKITGMGIPEGVTLIVGGGYHGKSTLLNAIELGVYNHIPGDGREGVVTIPDAVKIRAADGRSISNTDISPFINDLPLAKDTACFTTQNASGSTSQAATISEAIEAGASLLLLDEDTSATNFMIRDSRMQALVPSEEEPITPFIDKVRQLNRDLGISTIVVMGGAGDYFSVADHVIQMSEYQPHDVTGKAHHIAETIMTGRVSEGGKDFGKINTRIPEKAGVPPNRSGREKISAPRVREIRFGTETIDLGDMEQLVDISQTRALGHAIRYSIQKMDGKQTLREIADHLISEIQEHGLDILLPYISGDIAAFRPYELIGAINRIRTLKVKQKITPA